MGVRRRRKGGGARTVLQLQEKLQRGFFVGREAELDAVLRSLEATPAKTGAKTGAKRRTPRVFHLSGLGGVGKTALLEELAARARDLGARVTAVDARDIAPTIEGFTTALAHALGPRGFGRSGAHLLTIDTLEAIRPLDRWLRETFLAGLPIHVVTVLATREPPSADWRSAPGWGDVIAPLPLVNLDERDARDLLERRHVPSAARGDAVAFTHGHPLALLLVADVCARNARARFRAEQEPELVEGLLRRFLHEVEDGEQRRALEAAAVVRSLTEPLLAWLLERDASAPFAWLRGLSFMRAGRFGLFPHDVVREALVADLRWRDPRRYANLVERAHAYYAERLARGVGRDPRITGDHLFLSRFAPGVGDVILLAESPAYHVEVATERDVPALVAMVRRHEGAASAKIAARWFDRQRDAILVVRDSSGTAAGFVAPLALERASAEDIEADPGTRAAWSFVRGLGRRRRRDAITHFRFWMAKDSYQSTSEAQSVCLMAILHHEVTTPNVVRSFWACRTPEAFAETTRHSGSMRLPEADFEVGGTRYGVYSHDWRKRSPAEWLAGLAKVAAGGPPTEPIADLPLDERRFREAVADALRAYRSDHDLAQNPLKKESLEALRTEIRGAVEALGATPRGRKLALAVRRTFLDAAATQEVTAEELGLPFSTYRRHLTSGIAAVTQWLWNQESDGR